MSAVSKRRIPHFSIEQRVSGMVDLAPPIRDGWERIAARRLYSTLTQFEEIAVLAASRGDATHGQLSDEQVHRDTFLHLAKDCGGLEPPSEETVDLVSRLSSLEGAASLALLNLVAEQWLETVFKQFSGWGHQLFHAIGLDESRHVNDAWDFPPPSPDELMQHLPGIESALCSIALSPGFALPIVHLFGAETFRKIGIEALKRHEATCARLGVTPGPAMRRLSAVCRGHRKAPPQIDITGRQVSLIRAAIGPAPVWTQFTRPKCSTVNVIEKCLHALEKNPELRWVFRRETVYQQSEARVLVRVKHPDGIGSVMITKGNVFTQLKAKVRRLRKKALPVLPRLGDAIALLPPAPASLAVTALTDWHFSGGSVPLFEAEGVPIAVAIGYNGIETVISITMDHRLFDASHLASLRDFLKVGD